MRIASLVPSATEILFAVGAGDDIVAGTHECEFPLGTTPAPAVTSSLIGDGLPSALIDKAATTSVRDAHTIYSIDEHALGKAAPNLVITQSLCPGCAGDTTESCALPSGAVVARFDPTSLEEVLVSIGDVATAAGVGDAGRSVVARLRSRLHWVSSLVADFEPPRVAVIGWPNPLYAPGHWIPDMVEAAGGISVFGTGGRPSRLSSVDELAKTRPDVVVLAFCGSSLYETQGRFKELTSDPDFIEATRFARTFAVDGSFFFSRPGPRLVDGIELLAWALHRCHPKLQPPVGRGAKLIEAGWADVASLPLAVKTAT